MSKEEEQEEEDVVDVEITCSNVFHCVRQMSPKVLKGILYCFLFIILWLLFSVLNGFVLLKIVSLVHGDEYNMTTGCPYYSEDGSCPRYNRLACYDKAFGDCFGIGNAITAVEFFVLSLMAMGFYLLWIAFWRGERKRQQLECLEKEI